LGLKATRLAQSVQTFGHLGALRFRFAFDLVYIYLLVFLVSALFTAASSTYGTLHHGIGMKVEFKEQRTGLYINMLKNLGILRINCWIFSFLYKFMKYLI